MAQRLKSLEMHGYKTFANRTLFEFPGVITAIVGPNGSGKSNIADSIRWVLGEQAFSLLRGKKTEDMIFAGSEVRPRSSMAQTTILFDNEDGWLPIDFSEVSVTRRAYRDGENEYLLNGQRVRLKEINELLSQSGLSQRTYTIIGQGLVDEALSLKPEERRRFFEEAAGIGLYRARREETINKLEATRRNLERIFDILGELTPRLKSLEKQAQKAIDFERVKADLKLSLRDWYGFHWHRLQKDILNSRELVRQADNRLEESQANLRSIDEKFNSIRSEIFTLRNNLEKWHEQAALIHTEIEHLERKKAVNQERKNATLEKSSIISSEIMHLEEEIKVHQEILGEIKIKQQKLEVEISQLLEDIKKNESDLALRIDQRMKSEKEMERFHEKQRLIENQLMEKRVRLESLVSNKVQIKNSLAEAKEKLEEIIKLSEAAGKEETQASQIELSLQTVHTNLLEKKEKSQEILDELEEKLRVKLKQVDEKSAKLVRLKTQWEVLHQAQQNLEGLSTGVISLFDAVKKGLLAGKISALADMFEIPAEYEQAIAAVLGEHLESVLLDAEVDPESIIKYLADGDKGRAFLIPVNSIKGKQLQTRIDNKGYLGIASELIKTSLGYKKVVDVLLGSVFIVKDRKVAHEIIHEIPLDAKIVTLAGEVFAGNGIISAGRESRSSLLTRPRQKIEIEKRIESLEREISAQQNEIIKFQNKEKLLNSEIELLDSRLRQSVIEQNSAREKAQKAIYKFEQLSLSKRSYQEQAEKLSTQIEQNNNDENILIDEIKTINEILKKYQEEGLIISKKLEAIPIAEIQTEISNLLTSKAVTERAVEDINRQYQERSEYINTSTFRLNELETQNKQLKKTEQELIDEKLELEDLSEKFGKQIMEIQALIIPTETDLRDKEKQLDLIMADQNSARQNESFAERQATQARLELARQRESLDQLRKRVEEDFGLVAFDYGTDEPGQSPLPLEGMVEQLPILTELPAGLEESLSRQKAQLRRLGPVNLDAKKEYEEVNERYDFLSTQRSDLMKADQDLLQVIVELDLLMKQEFQTTFSAVAIEFKKLFTRLFGGGTAELILTDEDNINETGVDIIARLPGRREQGLSLLSGGEKSLTAVALIFALLKVSPTPFCILDEVDAMLDESNVGRFCDLLKELSQKTQFIVITHNRNTVQVADVIYGITMGKDSVSQSIGLRMDEISEEMVN